VERTGGGVKALFCKLPWFVAISNVEKNKEEGEVREKKKNGEREAGKDKEYSTGDM